MSTILYHSLKGGAVAPSIERDRHYPILPRPSELNESIDSVDEGGGGRERTDCDSLLSVPNGLIKATTTATTTATATKTKQRKKTDQPERDDGDQR